MFDIVLLCSGGKNYYALQNMFLEATDPKYRLHKPTNLSVVVGENQQRMIPKKKKKYTSEDISSISKDAKI